MTRTKSELEDIIAPLGDNPVAEIARLQAIDDSTFVSIFDVEGLTVSNEELKDLPDSLEVMHERIRRSFFGVIAFNQGAPLDEKLYPTTKMLSFLANGPTTATLSWLAKYGSEVENYSEALDYGPETPITRDSHNDDIIVEVRGAYDANELVSWQSSI